MSYRCHGPWWREVLHRIAPFLFRGCIAGNWHWWWDRHCACPPQFGDDRCATCGTFATVRFFVTERAWRCSACDWRSKGITNA